MKKIDLSQSILNTDVSYYENYKQIDGKKVNLLDLLKSFSETDNVNSFKVRRLRTFDNEAIQKADKAEIACFTPSGIFNKRNVSGLLSHTGLIQFDIDKKDNLHIENYKELKIQLSKIINVAYAGLSVSGKGYWGIIPVKDSDKHKEYFKYIQKVFESWGIVIDQSGSDVSRLRIASYDADPYYNHFAIPLDKYFTPKITILKEAENRFDRGTLKDVAGIVYMICKYQIDVTQTYHDWFNIGCALSTLPNGRNFYHQVSRFHKEYDPNSTDRQFNKCCQYKSHVKVFFSICKSHGISFSSGQIVTWNGQYELI